jgi:hypothetical protein
MDIMNLSLGALTIDGGSLSLTANKRLIHKWYLIDVLWYCVMLTDGELN